MKGHLLNYTSLFSELRSYLLSKNPVATIDITKEIKAFFRAKFSSNYNVLCSHTESNEYLTDVLVTTFNPKAIVQKRTLQVIPPTVSVILAAESELGGVGASSAYGVMKNVVEDYLKLLVIRCQYRVMVFTSLPYANEDDHVRNRVEVLRSLYQRSADLSSGVLLVHLSGTQPISTQVQALVNKQSIRGFEISANGQSAQEIDPTMSCVSANNLDQSTVGQLRCQPAADLCR